MPLSELEVGDWVRASADAMPEYRGLIGRVASIEREGTWRAGYWVVFLVDEAAQKRVGIFAADCLEPYTAPQNGL